MKEWLDRFMGLDRGRTLAISANGEQAFAEFEELHDRFYGYESPFGMHPDIKLPGVEMCTGALGHGLAIAMGMALCAHHAQEQAATVFDDVDVEGGTDDDA